MAVTRQVLVTRPADGAERTAMALRGRGFTPIVAPLLEIAPAAAILPDPAMLQAILATSSHALPTLRAALRTLPLLAVGDTTAAAARAAGHTNVTSAAGDAQALAHLVAQRCNPAYGTLLLVSGAGQGSPLAEALRISGFDVLHRIVYAAHQVTTLPTPASLALRSGALYAATFFSAETARAFAALAESAGLRDTVAPVVALAIGRAAAAALAVLPWRCVRVASRPTQDELLALL